MQNENNILNTYNYKNNKYLTKEQERQLLIYAKQKDEIAVNKLINNNLKLITKIASYYKKCGIPINDLIQEGIIGLLEAIEKYDLNQNCKFITYAYYKIKSNIKRAIYNNSRIVRVPIHMQELHIKYKEICHNEYKSKGYIPNNEQLAKLLNISINNIYLLKEIDKTTISVNIKINEEEDKELIDNITSTEMNIEDKIINKDIKEHINKLLSIYDLDKRDVEIIKYRFGFYNNRKYTYKEIAEILNISMESTRRYYERAINRLRQLDYTKNLLDYSYDKEKAMSMLNNN